MAEPPLIYLASPIDQVDSDDLALLNQVRKETTRSIARAGAYVYRPDRPFGGYRPATGAIKLINEAALEQAAGVLFLAPEGIPSEGSLAEQKECQEAKIPYRVFRFRLGAEVKFQLDAMVADLMMVVLSVLILPEPVTQTAVRSDLGLPAIHTLEIGSKRDTRPLSDSDLQFRRSHPQALLPTRAHRDDVGWDLYAVERTLIQPGESADVPFGTQMAAPYGWWGRISGRSSTLRGRGLAVQEGVIDPGYRGDLYAACLNTTQQPVTVERGERIAQLILMPAHHVRAVEVSELPKSERGERGYGSTGQ